MTSVTFQGGSTADHEALIHALAVHDSADRIAKLVGGPGLIANTNREYDRLSLIATRCGFRWTDEDTVLTWARRRCAAFQALTGKV